MVLPEHVGSHAVGAGIQQRLDRLHGVQKIILPDGREFAEDGPDLLFRSSVQGHERLPAFLSELQQDLTRVLRRLLLFDETSFLETTQDPAQVSRIETKRVAELCRRRLFAVRQLIQGSRLSEGKWTVKQAFIQKPNVAGIETVESTHGRDPSGRNLGARPGSCGLGRTSHRLTESIKLYDKGNDKASAELAGGLYQKTQPIYDAATAQEADYETAVSRRSSSIDDYALRGAADSRSKRLHA